MLHADYVSILKPVDEKYKEKMNQIKNGQKGKSPYTEKINRYDLYTALLVV